VDETRATARTVRRFALELSARLGAVYKKTAITLIKRSRMGCQMLVGREIMAGDSVPRPKAAFMTRQTCNVG